MFGVFSKRKEDEMTKMEEAMIQARKQPYNFHWNSTDIRLSVKGKTKVLERFAKLKLGEHQGIDVYVGFKHKDYDGISSDCMNYLITDIPLEEFRVVLFVLIGGNLGDIVATETLKKDMLREDLLKYVNR